jgi:putative ABC transport system permease protein
MQLPPVITALRRHKAGALLIAAQTALTLAIICNALFIIVHCVERIAKPTGLHESGLFVIGSSHDGMADPGTNNGQKVIDAYTKADLTALRALPSVASAYQTNTISLNDYNYRIGFRLTQDSPILTRTAILFADTSTLDTLGIQLAGGRNFLPDEINAPDGSGSLQPSVIIVTKSIASILFPNGDAVGKQVFLVGADQPSTIIGVVNKLHSSYTTDRTEQLAWNTMLIPSHVMATSAYYVIRAKEGQMQEAMDAAKKALYAQDPQRLIEDGKGSGTGVRSFSDIRATAYQSDKLLAILMGAVVIILIAVTAGGIIGLSSFWVGQRRRQIGVRRALGATSRDILTYFLSENAVICGAGVCAGIGLAFLLNNWTMSQFELSRLPVIYIVVGAVLQLLLGQAAALPPALRASRVPPMEAFRTG